MKSKIKLFYLDHNNLYGSAQIMKLPKCNFRWASELQKRAIGIYLETLKLRFKEKTFKEENSSLENILNDKNIPLKPTLRLPPLPRKINY